MRGDGRDGQGRKGKECGGSLIDRCSLHTSFKRSRMRNAGRQLESTEHDVRQYGMAYDDSLGFDPYLALAEIGNRLFAADVDAAHFRPWFEQHFLFEFLSTVAGCPRSRPRSLFALAEIVGPAAGQHIFKHHERPQCRTPNCRVAWLARAIDEIRNALSEQARARTLRAATEVNKHLDALGSAIDHLEESGAEIPPPRKCLDPAATSPATGMIAEVAEGYRAVREKTEALEETLARNIACVQLRPGERARSLLSNVYFALHQAGLSYQELADLQLEHGGSRTARVESRRAARDRVKRMLADRKKRLLRNPEHGQFMQPISIVQETSEPEPEELMRREEPRFRASPHYIRV